MKILAKNGKILSNNGNVFSSEGGTTVDNTLVVNCTTTDSPEEIISVIEETGQYYAASSLVIDKTFEEIIEAASSGKAITIIFSMDLGSEMFYISTSNLMVNYSSSEANGIMAEFIKPTGNPSEPIAHSAILQYAIYGSTVIKSINVQVY